MRWTTNAAMLDPGCSSLTDGDEHGNSQCDDGIDNDNDGRADLKAINGCGPRDAQCNSPLDMFQASELHARSTPATGS